MTPASSQIDHLLAHGVSEVYPTPGALAEALSSGRRLRIYVGVDPTSPSLHIGHAMQFRKLREFQDLGHEVILLIGSFTAMIGDPTDKLAVRKQLTSEEVVANAKTYKKQAAKILRFTGENPAKLMFNHKWLSKMSFSQVVDLASHFTVQQMMERDMFEKRLLEGKPIHLHEFFYPLMQGYDSVAMDVDVEIGGSDQIFNMLAGRTLMKAMKGKEKFVLAVKLLTNDEGKKMSKSEGGFIALTDAPEDMFGKLMAMGDSMILPYFELVVGLPSSELDQIRTELSSGVNPRDIKLRLAETITSMYHTVAAAKRAKKHFISVFSQKEMPTEIVDVQVPVGVSVIQALVSASFATSNGEARRLIEQGGVKLGDAVVTDVQAVVSSLPVILQKGKRHFARLVV
ncbi:tyrosine--tRNA ligase [Patescibacteria group bacterium]|nr:tyrosine--tRNA ligase [Patescibacteria group bacterium]